MRLNVGFKNQENKEFSLVFMVTQSKCFDKHNHFHLGCCRSSTRKLLKRSGKDCNTLGAYLHKKWIVCHGIICHWYFKHAYCRGDELNRGYFDDYRDLKKHGGKVSIYVFHLF
jgi:phosphatidylserine/phosphatidylglycerophosphate/cardiolipin synthase-like enzyme